jgi:DNA-binding NarL/FixJ family response regulator
MKQTKILIVDDHPLVRQGLSLNLATQPDFEVCGEVETEHEALEMVEKMQPDLMLIDISLRSGNGIEVIKQVKNRHPRIKMLAISAFQENFYGISEQAGIPDATAGGRPHRAAWGTVCQFPVVAALDRPGTGRKRGD